MKQVTKLGVMGNPIGHSLSPEIHLMFAKQFGDEISYDKVEIPLGEFESAIGEMIDEGYHGLNVTIPFKLDAFRCSTKCSSQARQSRAVNTLTFQNNKILGENTDGTGFIRDLEERLKFFVEHKKILILGAGGGVRGILPALMERMPKSVTVANRSVARAQELCDEFGIQSILYDETGSESYDLIVNATPTSLQNKAPWFLRSHLTDANSPTTWSTPLSPHRSWNWLNRAAQDTLPTVSGCWLNRRPIPTKFGWAIVRVPKTFTQNFAKLWIKAQNKGATRQVKP